MFINRKHAEDKNLDKIIDKIKKPRDLYTAGLFDGMSVNKMYPESFRFMGYDSKDLTKIIEIFEKEIQMSEATLTREEAIKIYAEKLMMHKNGAAIYIDTLVAIGVLKVKEDIEPELDEKISLKLNRSLDTEQVNSVLCMIDRLGYKIIKE